VLGRFDAPTRTRGVKRVDVGRTVNVRIASIRAGGAAVKPFSWADYVVIGVLTLISILMCAAVQRYHLGRSPADGVWKNPVGVVF
jgi:hypothetical protein